MRPHASELVFASSLLANCRDAVLRRVILFSSTQAATSVLNGLSFRARSHPAPCRSSWYSSGEKKDKLTWQPQHDMMHTRLSATLRRLFEYLGSLLGERSNMLPDQICLLIRCLYTGTFESSLIMKTLDIHCKMRPSFTYGACKRQSGSENFLTWPGQ